MNTQPQIATTTSAEPSLNDPMRLYWLQCQSKKAYRDAVVATERYRRALKARNVGGHFEIMEAAHRERARCYKEAPATQSMELIARQDAAKILRGDTNAKKCRCKSCACNCDQPEQVQCDTHGPRE